MADFEKDERVRVVKALNDGGEAYYYEGSTEKITIGAFGKVDEADSNHVFVRMDDGDFYEFHPDELKKIVPKMIKVKIRDTIIIGSDYSPREMIGMKGKVICRYRDRVFFGVDFGRDVDGINLEGKCKNGHGLWVHKKDAIKVNAR